MAGSMVNPRYKLQRAANLCSIPAEGPIVDNSGDRDAKEVLDDLDKLNPNIRDRHHHRERVTLAKPVVLRHGRPDPAMYLKVPPDGAVLPE